MFIRLIVFLDYVSDMSVLFPFKNLNVLNASKDCANKNALAAYVPSLVDLVMESFPDLNRLDAYLKLGFDDSNIKYNLDDIINSFENNHTYVDGLDFDNIMLNAEFLLGDLDSDYLVEHSFNYGGTKKDFIFKNIFFKKVINFINPLSLYVTDAIDICEIYVSNKDMDLLVPEDEYLRITKSFGDFDRSKYELKFFSYSSKPNFKDKIVKNRGLDNFLSSEKKYLGLTKSFLKILPEKLSDNSNSGMINDEFFYDENTEKYIFPVLYEKQYKSFLMRLKNWFMSAKASRRLSELGDSLKTGMSDYNKKYMSYLETKTKFSEELSNLRIGFNEMKINFAKDDNLKNVCNNIANELERVHSSVTLTNVESMPDFDIEKYRSNSSLISFIFNTKNKQISKDVIYDSFLQVSDNLSTYEQKLFSLEHNLAQQKNNINSLYDSISSVIINSLSSHSGDKEDFLDLCSKFTDSKQYDYRGHRSALGDIGLPFIEYTNSLGLTNLDPVKISSYMVLHDIGKMHISYELLNQGKLDKTSYGIVKSHPKKGYEFLKSLGYEEEACLIAGCHHRHPDEKKQNSRSYGVLMNEIPYEELPESVKITTIIDSFHAMSANRTYNTPKNRIEALEEINSNKGTQFEEVFAQAFIDFAGTESGKKILDKYCTK